MNGSANLLYGNYKKGKIETKGNLTVSSSGDILVDSDLKIAGSINLSGNSSDSDITLDLSNIGGELKENKRCRLCMILLAHIVQQKLAFMATTVS